MKTIKKPRMEGEAQKRDAMKRRTSDSSSNVRRSDSNVNETRIPPGNVSIEGRIVRVNFAGVVPTRFQDRVREEQKETPVKFLPTYHMDFPFEALHGLAGKIVNKLMPETESHPAAILLHTLTRFGNLIGRNAYHQVEATRHYCNLFIVLVGRTSKARKGTANDRVEEIFTHIDSTWESACQSGGFGSGEGVINAIRDEQEITVRGKVQVIPGIKDKRLFIREGEFSRILAVGKREGNLLSQVLRDSWDSKTLRNSVKNSPQIASEPHVSCVCDITQDELKLTLAAADRSNGFANRFLWAFVERTKLKPFGGAALEWSMEQRQLREALRFAQKQQRVFMDEAARTMWRRKYPQLSQEHDGIVGAVSSRAETQVLRLALIYAMLDQDEHIRSEHLQAALALWDYCLRSIEQVFGDHGVVTREQQQILDEAKLGPTTLTEFREKVFKRNRAVDLIRADLDALVEKKLLAASDDLESGETMWQLL